MRRLLAILALAAWAASPVAAQRPRTRRAARPAPTACPAPSPATWAAIRDTLWPLIAHRDSDQAWAHLQPDSLPRASATWCNPLEKNSGAVTAGRDIYARHCATCHGQGGAGDGPGAGVDLPSPFDFTAPIFAGMRIPPGPGALYAIVTRGIGGTVMRGFGELGAWERLAVLAYVTRFPGDSAIREQKAWADSLNARRPRGP